jgi:hypothetical protein
LLDFLEILDSIIEARRPINADNGREPTNPRPGWRPPVLNGQREVLALLRSVRSDAPEVWEAVFALLSKHAAAMLFPAVEGAVAGVASGNGRYLRMPVSRQFAKVRRVCVRVCLCVCVCVCVCTQS